MADRKKLIELIISSGQVSGFAGALADHLIANGVTVIPCKVGDTIFEIDGEHGIVAHKVRAVGVVINTTATDDNGNEWQDFYTSEDIDTAYRTRRDAEANYLDRPKEDKHGAAG